MYQTHHPFPAFRVIAVLLVMLLSGCSGGGTGSSSSAQSDGPIRPNTPVVYEPEASLATVIGTEPLTVDVSNADRGYIMARYTGSAAKANIQITGSDGINYKYFLPPSDSYTALPLTSGNGTYQIDGYENVSGSEYISLFRESLEVTIENEFLPFLYPSQYVNFNADTQAVSTASEAVKEARSDLDAVSDIYHFVIENVVYDEEKAETVTSGYLPDVDETLSSGKGICFDYAALTAAMLRSQNIPTRLEIGYAGDIYHAWISVYVDEVGWIDKIIEFSGDGWTRMDPTFASTGSDDPAILEYIGDGKNYIVQYIR